MGFVQTALDVRLRKPPPRLGRRPASGSQATGAFRKVRRNIVDRRGLNARYIRLPRVGSADWAVRMSSRSGVRRRGPVIQLRAGPLRLSIDRKGYALGREAGPRSWQRRPRRGAPRRDRRRGHTATRTTRAAPRREGPVLAIDNPREIKVIIAATLRAQQVQPCAPASRQVGSPFKPIVIPGDRSRLYAGHDHHGHTGEFCRRPPVRPAYAPLTTTTSSRRDTLRSLRRGLRKHPRGSASWNSRAQTGDSYARRLGLDRRSPVPRRGFGAAEATLTE